MYAILIQLTINPQFASEAATTFTNSILPKVKSAPGFIAGYWVDPVNDKGFGFILFENADQAKSVLPPTIDWAAPGVIINKFDMRRVAVSIPC